MNIQIRVNIIREFQNLKRRTLIASSFLVSNSLFAVHIRNVATSLAICEVTGGVPSSNSNTSSYIGYKKKKRVTFYL